MMFKVLPVALIGVFAGIAVDGLLLAMISSAQIQKLVDERASCRKTGDFMAADIIKYHLEKQGIVVIDRPEIGWRYSDRALLDMSAEDDGNVGELQQHLKGKTLMELASLALYYREQQQPSMVFAISKLTVSKLKGILQLHRPEKEFSGRQWVDCASYFALAGANNTELYSLLNAGALAELKRLAGKRSWKSIDILSFCETLALSGEKVNQTVYELGAALLKERSKTENIDCTSSISRLSSGDYSLLDDRPMQALFLRVASKAQKYGRREGEESDVGPLGGTGNASSFQLNLGVLNEMFSNCSLPLYLDLGCSYGTSLLGLAIESLSGEERDMNFLGLELNPSAVTFANTVAHRWGLKGTCAFAPIEATQGLQSLLHHYAGPIHMITISFPTPFAVPGSGNSELPRQKANFLLTPELAALIREALQGRGAPGDRKHLKGERGSRAVAASVGGAFYFQTNAADVATYMRQLAEEAGLVPHATPGEAMAVYHQGRRQGAAGVGARLRLGGGLEPGAGAGAGAEWASLAFYEECGAAGAAQTRREARLGLGPAARPCGAGWLRASPLPSWRARTESEARHTARTASSGAGPAAATGRPVYRGLLRGAPAPAADAASPPRCSPSL